jgi:hypothetical protein
MRKKYPAGFLYLLGLIRGHFDEHVRAWPEKDSTGSVNTGMAIVTPIQDVLEVLKAETLKEPASRQEQL